MPETSLTRDLSISNAILKIIVPFLQWLCGCHVTSRFASQPQSLAKPISECAIHTSAALNLYLNHFTFVSLV
jgi:hypothetical protein